MIKRKKYNHTVPLEFTDKVRLQAYIKGLFPYLETGSAVKKAFHKRQIGINEKVGSTGDWVSAGDEITFTWSYEVGDGVETKINVVYNDEHLIVIVKPPGLSSSGNSRSMQQQLQSMHLIDNEGMLPFPFLIHRLDKATEGLMLAAKSISVRRLLAEMMEQHAIIKQYVLIVKGILSPKIQYIKTEIEGNPAITEIIDIIPLDTKDQTSKVYVRLHTGRTHQIRRHFKEINHPIIGDQLYHEGGLTFGSGLLLCAYYLEFSHPITKEIIKVEYPIPYKISKYKAL